jgi:hypothetical protein
MSNLNPGDDVVVSFDGLEHAGVVEQKMGKGWLRCKIRIDGLADYGNITPRLGIESVVCVRETDVRHTE